MQRIRRCDMAWQLANDSKPRRENSMRTTLEVMACCLIGAGIIPLVIECKHLLHAFYHYFS